MRLFTDEIYVGRWKSPETVGEGSLNEGLPGLWIVLACIQREFPINAGENFFPVVGFLRKSYCLGRVVSDC